MGQFIHHALSMLLFEGENEEEPRDLALRLHHANSPGVHNIATCHANIMHLELGWDFVQP